MIAFRVFTKNCQMLDKSASLDCKTLQVFQNVKDLFHRQPHPYS
jgi:hypothetical protein